MSMHCVRILVDLIAVLARLVTMVTAKLAKVGRAPICAARVQGSASGRVIIFFYAEKGSLLFFFFFGFVIFSLDCFVLFT